MGLKFKTGFLVGGLLAALALTNPSKDDHAKQLAESVIAPNVEGGRDNPIARIGTAFAQSFSDSVFDYHNYVLFSTTTTKNSDNRLTLGVFGMVMTEKNDD